MSSLSIARSTNNKKIIIIIIETREYDTTVQVSDL